MPDVASISAAAGVPLAPDVFTVAGFPAFVGAPGAVGFYAVAIIHAVAVVGQDLRAMRIKNCGVPGRDETGDVCPETGEHSGLEIDVSRPFL